MDYEIRKTFEAVEELASKIEYQKTLLKVLANQILRCLSVKTKEHLKEELKQKNPYELNVSDFGTDLLTWLDKGLSFKDIIYLIAGDLNKYVDW